MIRKTVTVKYSDRPDVTCVLLVNDERDFAKRAEFICAQPSVVGFSTQSSTDISPRK